MKSSISILAAFLTLVLFSQCAVKAKPQIPLRPKAIELYKLQAINLSEDMHEVSTKEDEILLFVALLDKKDSLFQVKQHWSLEHTFKERMEGIELMTQIVPDVEREQTLAFILVELDYEVRQPIEGILSEWITSKSSFKGISDPEIDRLLEYDDFLDLQYLNLNRLKGAKNRSIHFKGLQLFDRFEYVLEMRVSE